MLKNLSVITVAGLLASGCVIDLGNTTTATATDGTSNGTTDNTTSGTTTTGTTSGTTTDATATGSTTSPTTTSPTTTEGTSGSTGDTSGTTGGSQYGKCGWNAGGKYYACDTNGGVPGQADPDAISPIDCPDTLPAVGDKCDETSPVNFVGCCLPDGTNWYCDEESMVQMEPCGA